MAEYIDREAVMKIAKDGNHSDFGRSMADLTSLREVLEDTPTADVVDVRHGHWFLLDECANEGVYCSVCGKKVYRVNYANQKLKSKFCPNCGAKMDGGDNE